MENNNQGSSSRRIVYGGLLVLAVVSLVLQIIGLATPGWIVMRISSLDVKGGLWEVKSCLNGVCFTRNTKKSLKDLSPYLVLSDADVDEYRAGTIVGMISILISCACLLYQICRKATTSIGRESMWIIIHCVFSLLSAIVALIASGTLGRKLANSHRKLGTFSPYLIPYSISLTAVGGILAAFLFIIGVIQVIWLNYMSNQQQAGTMETYLVRREPHAVNQQIAGYPQNMNTHSHPPFYEPNAYSQRSQYPISYVNENPWVRYHSDRPNHSVSDSRVLRNHPPEEYHVQAGYGRNYYY